MTDEELIKTFEKDEGISISDVTFFNEYKHKLVFSIDMNKHGKIDEKYITSIDDIKLETPILISKLDKDGNRVNNKGDIISNSDDCKPSEATVSQWLHVRGTGKGHHDDETRQTYVGKWMIFVPIEQLDSMWEKIKIATKEGKLGIESKTSTAKPNPNATGPEKVIIVYTRDWTDEKDVMRVRKELRNLGIINKIPYKRDIDSIAGKYRVSGDKKISKYYWDGIEELDNCKQGNINDMWK